MSRWIVGTTENRLVESTYKNVLLVLVVVVVVVVYVVKVCHNVCECVCDGGVLVRMMRTTPLS